MEQMTAFDPNDPLGQWITETSIIGRNRRALSGDLFKSWEIWADAAGEPIWSHRRFSLALSSYGIFRVIRSNGRRWFDGIGIIHDPLASR